MRPRQPGNAGCIFMAYRKRLTPKIVNLFLAQIAEHCNVSRAAESLGIERCSFYVERKRNEKFKTAWDEARAIGISKLEEEAWRRAYDGVDEPVFYMGSVCGHVRKYSDTLLMFMLNGEMPHKYRRNVTAEVTGKNGAPLAPAAFDLKISFEDGGPGEG